jgi:hypothetical protein
MTTIRLELTVNSDLELKALRGPLLAGLASCPFAISEADGNRSSTCLSDAHGVTAWQALRLRVGRFHAHRPVPARRSALTDSHVVRLWQGATRRAAPSAP